MLRRAHSLHPDPLLRFNLARALEGDGDLDGAIEYYRGVIHLGLTVGRRANRNTRRHDQ